MKKIISLLTSLCIVFTMLGTFTAFADETTEISEIGTLAELEAFRDSVNAGNTYEGKTVTLTADIDMSEKYGEGKESWVSIGTPFELSFMGTFEGGGHKITELYINNTGVGLFGSVSGFADKASFANWDFDTVWDMDEALGRPVLRASRELPKHIHKVCADNDCADNHEDIEWTAWDSDSSLPDTAGNYYLTSDVTLTASWNVPDGVSLCMNGHVIALDGSVENEVTIEADASTVTVLTDCSDTEHKFSSGDKQWVRDEENGDKTITGGVIINPMNYAVFAASPLSVYNVSIVGSKGGIFNGDTLNIYNCTIAGNSGWDGICSYSELNMRDCTITENDGDGVYIGGGSISIGGKIIISDNTVNGKQYNLKLSRRITLQICSPLLEGSAIGISSSKRPFTDNPTAVTGENDTDYSRYFTADNVYPHITYSIENGANNVIYVTASTPTDFNIIRDGSDTILVSAPKAGTYTAILAIYSLDDKILRSVRAVPVTFDEASVKQIFDEDIDVDYSYTIQLMLWDSMNGMLPLCKSYSTSITKFNN